MSNPVYISIRVLALLGISCFGWRSVNAQAPPIQWQKCFGGSGSDQSRSIYQTTDSGFIIAGYSASADGDVTGLHGSAADYWLVKISASGTMLWQKCIGGSGSDLAYSIAQTKDKGYVVAGYSNSNDGDVSGNHGSWDYWVVKLNDTGGIQWQKSLGGSASDIPRSIQQTNDSGYIIAGASASINGDVTGNHDSADCWIIKLSALGDTQWERSYGGSRGDGGVSIKQTPDSGYIVACSSNSPDGDVTGNHGDYDVWILKLSAAGAIQWGKSYGGSGADYAEGILLTADGGYIVAASSNSADGDVTGNHGGFDYWLLKLSAAGSIQWQRSYGGSNDEFAASIQQTSDSGYIVCGTTFSNDSQVAVNFGNSDIWLTKLSAAGSIQWQKSLGGSSYDDAAAALQVSDSTYIVAGFSSSNDVEVTGNHGADDYWVVKLGDSLVVDTVLTKVNTPGNAVAISVIPNPAATSLTIQSNEPINQITITNLLGQTIFTHNHNTEQVQIDVANLPSGVYFVKINDCEVRKFVKE